MQILHTTSTSPNLVTTWVLSSVTRSKLYVAGGVKMVCQVTTTIEDSWGLYEDER